MGNIGESLKRKLGPLPVWAWVLIVGVVLYWYRNRQQQQQGTTGANPQAIQAEAQLIQAEGAAAAGTWGTPLPLSQGQSVYDPNSGSLLGTGTGNNLAASLIALIAALATRQPPGRHHRNGPRDQIKRVKHRHKIKTPKAAPHINKGGGGSRRQSHKPKQNKQARNRGKSS